jgi:subtilase family serine protease
MEKYATFVQCADTQSHKPIIREYEYIYNPEPHNLVCGQYSKPNLNSVEYCCNPLDLQANTKIQNTLVQVIRSNHDKKIRQINKCMCKNNDVKCINTNCHSYRYPTIYEFCLFNSAKNKKTIGFIQSAMTVNSYKDCKSNFDKVKK